MPIQSDADAPHTSSFNFFFFPSFFSQYDFTVFVNWGSGFRGGLKEQFVSVDVTPSHLFLDSFFSFLHLTKFSCYSTVLCAAGELLQY